MERGFILRILFFGLSVSIVIVTVILYFLYATNKLSSTVYTTCFLQSCSTLNKTCYQICPEHQPECIPANFTCQYHLANYTYVYHNRTYSITRQLPVDQACLTEMNCHFAKINSTVHFEKHDDEMSLSIGIAIITVMIMSCTVCVLLPFEYFWKKNQKVKEEESLLIKAEYQSV